MLTISNNVDMEKNIFASRMKEIRKKVGLSQPKLGELIGMSRFSIIDYESGKTSPDIDTLAKIANVLKVSAAFLMGETNEPNIFYDNMRTYGDGLLYGKIDPCISEAELKDKPLSRVANGLKSWEAIAEQKDDAHQPSSSAPLDDVIFVPIVSNKVVTACCGNGSAYAEDVVWEYEGRFPVPAKVLMGYTWQGCSYKIMDAEGSSMEPYIYNGDKVLFVEYCEVGVGDIVVVSINNRLFIKGIVKMNEKELCLRAYNWQISPDIVVNLEGDTEVCILGKVINVVSARSIPKMI